MSCSGDEHSAVHPWRVGVSYGFMWTTLRFDGAVEASLQQQALLIAVSYRATDRLTLQLSAGALIAGDINTSAASSRLRPGWVAAAGISWQLLDGASGRPFSTVAGTLAASSAPTVRVDTKAQATLTSLDVKGTAIIGKTFAGRFSPYVGAALFGGPVFWAIDGASVTGTDKFHYQVLAGMSVALPRALDLFVEGSALGERSLAAGLGASF